MADSTGVRCGESFVIQFSSPTKKYSSPRLERNSKAKTTFESLMRKQQLADERRQVRYRLVQSDYIIIIYYYYYPQQQIGTQAAIAERLKRIRQCEEQAMQLHRIVEPLLQKAQTSSRTTGSARGQQKLKRQAQAAAHAVLSMNQKTLQKLIPPQ